MTVPASRDPDRKRTATLAAFRRRWRLTLITMLIFALAGMVFCLSVAPVYVATAQLMLPVPPPDAEAPADGGAPQTNFVDDQVALLKSNRLLARVAQQEKLDEVPEFAPPRPSLLSRMIAAVSGHKDEAAPAETSDGIDPKFAPAIGRLQEMVQVHRVAQGNTLAVEAASHDRGRAARVANALVAAYLDATRVDHGGAPKAAATTGSETEHGSEWRDALRQDLAQNLAKGRSEIRRAEEALAYELKHSASRPEPSPVRTAPGKGVPKSATASAEERARAARSAADEANKRLDDVRTIAEDNGDPGKLGEVLSSAAQLSREYKDAKRDEAELSEKLGPRHPFLREARRERVRLASRLRSEAEKALPQLERNARFAASKAEGASRETKGTSSAPAVLPPPPPPVPLPTARSDADRAQSALQHLRDVTDSVLDGLRQKIDSVPAAALPDRQAKEPPEEVPEAQVISPALPPLKASFPNPALVLEFALATGLVLGLLLSALSENMARASEGGRDGGGP